METSRGLLACPHLIGAHVSLRLRKSRLHWQGCRHRQILGFVGRRELQTHARGIPRVYREGLDLSMRDVARRRVACTTASVSSTNARPERVSTHPGGSRPQVLV